MLKVVAFDIDGVLTDGNVYVNSLGEEIKKYRLTEIDALNDIKKLGFKIAAITGEKTPIVEVFKRRIEWDYFADGCKEKLSELKEVEKFFQVKREEICYIGDGKYDIPTIEYAGLGVCPQNAIDDVKRRADVILNGYGGESCVNELLSLLSGIIQSQITK